MSLTVKAIDAAKPEVKPYKLNDADDLYLYVATSGSKTWRANYRSEGKYKTVTYGRYPEITLSEARKLNENRRAQGTKLPTFTKVFEDWLPTKTSELTNAKHIKQVEETVRKNVLPYIGNMTIDAIPRAKMIEIVKRLADTPETASRVAGRISMIFDYAVDSGLIEYHGAADLSRVIAKAKTKPMPSIPPAEAGKLLADIHNYEEEITKLGLLLAAHTFVRVGELLGMRWDELKEKEHIWVIPQDRMKMDIPHVVPLSESVRGILKQLYAYTGNSALVLESFIKPGHPISENTLLFALYRLGYRGRHTVHGFRALASSVLNEHSPFKEDVIERQLAHKEKDKVRAAYNRAEFLPQRIELMTWWSNWLNQQLKDNLAGN